MSAIVWTTNDLAALQKAFASGALRVQIGDRLVIYRSQTELVRAIKVVSDYLNPPTDNATNSTASYKKNNKFQDGLELGDGSDTGDDDFF